MPESTQFGPLFPAEGSPMIVQMTVEEYETIRLIDLEGFTQEECAEQMTVARTTAQRIYADARKKIAESLVLGKVLRIEGGDYRICDGLSCDNDSGCHRRRCGRRHFHDDIDENK